MRAITERFVIAVLAAAEKNSGGFFSNVFDWPD